MAGGPLFKRSKLLPKRKGRAGGKEKKMKNAALLEDLAEDLVGEIGAGGALKGLEVSELLEHTLLGGEILVGEATEGKHSQARVLDLRKLVLLELAGVLALHTHRHNMHQ